MISYSKKLHESLIKGEKKAIAWGMSADASYKLKKAPYKFEFIIDGTKASDKEIDHFEGIPVLSPKSLEQSNTSEYVIVVFADLAVFLLPIQAQIRRYGEYPIATPFCPWRQFGKATMLARAEQFLAPYIQQRRGRLVATQQPPKHIVLWLFQLVRGGAEKQTVLLALGLRQQGYEVSLITCLTDDPATQDWQQKLAVNNINRIRLPAIREGIQLQASTEKSLVNALLPLFNSFATYWIIETNKALQKLKSDMVIAYMIEGAMIASIAGLIQSVRNIVFSVRNIVPAELSDDAFCYQGLAIAKHAVPDFLKLLISAANVVMTSNSMAGQRSYAKEMGITSDQISIVTNGLELPNKANYSHTSTINDIVVIGAMRLVEQKRPLLFLECISLLREHITNLKVYLLGDGPLKKQVIQYVEDLNLTSTVKLTGAVDNPFEYMQIAKVVLHTAAKEGYPNVLLEAQAAGCAVVTCNVGGCQEVFNESVKPFSLCNSDKASDLVDYVLTALQPEVQSLFKEQIPEVIKSHSIAKLAQKTVAVGLGNPSGVL